MASPDQLITIQLLPLTFIYHNSAAGVSTILRASCKVGCSLNRNSASVVHVCPPHRRPSQLYACPFDRTRPDRQGYGLIMRRCLSPNGEHESSQDKVKPLPLHHRRQTKAKPPMVQPTRGDARTLCKVHRSRNNSGQYTSVYKVATQLGIIRIPARNS